MKSLVITGASKGIGKATAELFNENGWQVINLSRSNCPISNVENINIDLSKSGWQDQWRSQLQEKVKHTDQLCLIHNAAFFQNDSIQSYTPEALRQAFEVNLIAPAILNQIFLPIMKSSSSILYVGSTLSEKAVANCASYAASKHAIAGLMKATCQDLIGTGIHTACVCPGFTDTEMMRDHLNNDPQVMAQIKASISAQRFIEPREIAEVLYFAANHPVINGSVLHSNLGQVEH